MIQRATGPQCLSSRVSALADGSLPDDVRDRALAHVTSCPDCRADLEAELLLRARLRALAAPRPSSSLVSSLLAMGEPGGPVPPRAGHVPGMPRPAPVAIRREPATDAPWQPESALRSLPALRQRVTAGRRFTSRGPQPFARQATTSHLARPVGAGGRGPHGSSRRRAVVGATAGAVGAGVIAAALASGLPAAPQVTQAQVHEQASAVDVSARLAHGGSDRPSAGFAAHQAAGQGTGAGVSQVGGISGVEAVFSTTGGTAPWLPRASTTQAVGPTGVTTTLLNHLLASAYRAVGTPPERQTLTGPAGGTRSGR